MAASELNDMDVFGAAPGTGAAQPAAGDIPPPPAKTPPDSVPVVVDINHGTVLPGEEAKPQAQALSDAQVFGASAVPTHGDDWLGFQAGLVKPLDNASVWVEKGLENLGVPVVEAEHAIGAQSAQDVEKAHSDYLAAQAAQGRTPGWIGKAGGEFVGTLPTLALGGPITQGLASGALTSDAQDVPGILRDAAIGGAVGKLGAAAMGGLQKAISPAISPYVQTLLDAGVKLTPGQILGGAAHRLEDAATSTWGVGDAIRNAQIRGLQSFNAAAINRSLEPLGISLPSHVQSGRAAVDFAHQALSDAYDQVTPQLTVQADPRLQHAVATAVYNAQQGLTADTKQQLADIVANRLWSRFSPAAGTMDGATFKDVDAQLGQQARKFSASPDPNQQNLGEALGQVQDELRTSAARQNPAHAQRLNDINVGYANLVRVERAASALGARDGVFTPSQLQNAVKAGDSSAHKNAFARGDALMQDLSDAGLKVLPSTVPDSGTALRYAVSELPILLGVGAESHVLPLGAAGGALLGGGLVGGAYTKVGQRVVTPLLTQRPAVAPHVANLLSLAKAPVAHLSSTVTPILEYAGQASAPPGPR